jgi:hypothetical protein
VPAESALVLTSTFHRRFAYFLNSARAGSEKLFPTGVMSAMVRRIVI